MFEMNYIAADGKVVRGGMAFDGHADRPVYVTKGNSMITKKDWKRLKQLARDELPPPGSSHLPPLPKRGPKLDLIRQKEAREDGEAFDADGLDKLRHFLRGRGLTDLEVEEALEHARADLDSRDEGVLAEAKRTAHSFEQRSHDALPVAGSAHALAPRNAGALIKRDREPGSKIGIPAEDHATRFAKRYPEAERVAGGLGTGSYGTGQFDSHHHRDRRQAHDQADGKARGRLEDRLGFSLPGVGEWPERKW